MEVKARTSAAGHWLNERLGLDPVREFLAHKTVPKHSSTVWYYFGGITLFLFGVQVAPGMLLLLYYRPTSTEAYESVQFIVTEVQFGWLIRSIHSWSANLMMLTAIHPYVQRRVPARLSPAAGSDLVERHRATRPDDGLWL